MPPRSCRSGRRARPRLVARAGRPARPSTPARPDERVGIAAAAADRRRAASRRAVDRRRRDRRLAARPAAGADGPRRRADRAGSTARVLMPIKLPSFRAAPRRLPARPLDEVPVVRGDAVQQAARQGAPGLPDLRPPLPAVGRGPARPPRSTTSSFDERDAGLESVDPLGFVDQKPYPDRRRGRPAGDRAARRGVWGTGAIDGTPVAICVMDFGFMGGSMGAVVGEKVTRAAEAALADRIPLVVVSASRRRPDAGGHAGADAARQDRGRPRAAAAAGVPFISS